MMCEILGQAARVVDNSVLKENSRALYLVGVVQGTQGIFRSDDSARTWTRINEDQHQWGLILHVTGDPKQYGRVYVGTHGRRIVYSDSVAK